MMLGGGDEGAWVVMALLQGDDAIKQCVLDVVKDPAIGLSICVHALQCVAMCCGVLPCVAEWCSVLHL